MRLNLLFSVWCNTSTGYGHFYRSNALARVAHDRGHIVTVACDRKPLYGLPWLPTVYDSPDSLAAALEATSPDWLIVDIPHDLPEWIRGMTRARICTLNGIGYNQQDGADLRIIQGVADLGLPGSQDRIPVLKGAEYVILRPELAHYRGQPRGEMTAVWGGGVDVMGLLKRFPVACPGELALLLAGDMAPIPALNLPTQTVVRLRPESEQVFDILAGSKKLVTAMGVICWEANYLGIPTFTLSATSLHLRFALGMATHGYIKAWPEVGLPSNEVIKNFISSPFRPTRRVDLLGAERVMKVIEDYG